MYFLVNTNWGIRPESTKEMLDEQKVAAYYDRKEKIEELSRGDKVFLYRRGLGIIATGIATGKLEIKEGPENLKEDIGEEYFMKLDEFKKLKAPLPASEIKKITVTNPVFRHTLYQLREESGKRLWDAIQSM